MAMDVNEIRQQLEHELRSTASRLREQGSLVDPRPLDATPMEQPQGDPIDRIEATESRLALHRLRDGSYGTCAECRDPIAPGRLRAIPEATMCVRCQERIEPAQVSRRTVRAFYAEPPASVDEPDDD
jgi:DnaK suppressor protein